MFAYVFMNELKDSLFVVLRHVIVLLFCCAIVIIIVVVVAICYSISSLLCSQDVSKYIVCLSIYHMNIKYTMYICNIK